MAMDLRDPNVWISHLLENLPEAKLACALKEDNPAWEYIDGAMLKLGSLAHDQLDIPEIQRRGLELLASESKDFRLLAHLLRTLQHAGNPLLALRLLALYVERPCTWMAVLGAIDAALILRFAGMPAGWARAAWAMLATALMIALANWGIAATQMGMSMGLNPLDSAMKLGMGHAWTLLGLANHTIDLVWMGVALVVAAIAAR